MNLLSSIFGNKIIAMEDWKHPNTIVGPTAEGARYFPRTRIEARIWRKIEKGSHILFSAPRRVGKSSVMIHMANNAPDGYACCFENISSDSTAKDFYNRLLNLILRQVSARERNKGRFKAWLSALGVDEISLSGIRFSSSSEINYKDRLLTAISKLNETDFRVVLFLDEFPDVIKNIRDREGEAVAKDVLHTLRSLRHNQAFRQRFILVLAGSIGLEHIVKQFDRIAVINDMFPQTLPALTPEEAPQFIQHLVAKASMNINATSQDYLLNRIAHAVPYYIQLMIDKCDDLLFAEGRTELQTADIDAAWEAIMADQKHFSDWSHRLQQYFPQKSPFFQHLLTRIAHFGTMSIQEAFDMANRYEIPEWKEAIDDVLVRDGYLQQVGQNFQFLSPLLREWWKRRYPRFPEK